MKMLEKPRSSRWNRTSHPNSTTFKQNQPKLTEHHTPKKPEQGLNKGKEQPEIHAGILVGSGHCQNPGFNPESLTLPFYAAFSL